MKKGKEYLFYILKVGRPELKIRLLHSMKLELLLNSVDISVVRSAPSQWMSYSTALQSPFLSFSKVSNQTVFANLSVTGLATES